MDTKPYEVNRRSKFTIIVVLVVLFFAGAYVGMQYEIFLSSTSTAVHDQSVPSPIVTTTAPAVVAPAPSATQAVSSCANVTLADTSSWGLGPFANAFKDGVLTDGDKATIKCYFNDPSYYTAGNPRYRINLDKNFTNFVFYLAEFTAEEGTAVMDVTDPENNLFQVTIYFRIRNNQTQIIDIGDPKSILQ